MENESGKSFIMNFVVDSWILLSSRSKREFTQGLLSRKIEDIMMLKWHKSYCRTTTKGPKWHWLPCVCFNFQLYHLHYERLHKRLKSSIQVACIESQSFVVEDKQNYYHPLPVSVKAHLACHSNSCFVCKWYSWKRLKGALSLGAFCRGTAAYDFYL